MSKFVKQLMIDDLRRSLNGVRDVLVVGVKGIDAITDNQMRLDLRKQDITVMVVKNSLARLVCKEVGLEHATDYLDGPSALVWGGPSVVDLAKAIDAWAKKIKTLEVRGGASEGQKIGAEDVKALLNMPSKEELIGQVLGLLLSPPRQVLSMLTAPASQVLSQLEKNVEGKSEGGSSESEPPAPAPAA